MINLIQNNFLEAQIVLNHFISDTSNFDKIALAGDEMVNAIGKNKKIVSCGNGGSLSDAMHFAEELTGRFRKNRKALPAIAISDPTHITCVANDFGFDYVFSRYIDAVCSEGDVLLAISTSGNSKNITNAAKVAKDKKMFVVGLTGKDGGELAKLCDLEIRVPHFGFSDRIQEIHIKIIHILINYIEKKLNISIE